jgi:hypothetical protein
MWRRAKLSVVYESSNGIASFDRLVSNVMSSERYRSATCVLDHG